MLFRKGFLTVVVATGTLALGLNMPCKTVVFFGDSVFLTALNYLQAAGRAGRRGFDLLGNVVFAGLAPERVFEIMSSTLPDLRGHFPLSTTLVLRLLGLLHHTKNSEYATKAIHSLLSQTHLYLGGPSGQMAIKHHLRFSIEYLRRQHLLSHNGAPLNFAGLVGHLYFTENAVFAFHSLLKEGYFHKVCEDIYRKPEDVVIQLVLVLAHLFCRIPIHGGGDDDWIKKVVHRSPSVVLLPRLPSQAEEILLYHNRETLEIFRTYASSYVEQHLSGKPDHKLPFTKCTVQEAHRPGTPSLIKHLPPTKLRSPFAALSGFTDEFRSIHDLCTTLREGVFLEESAVPYIPIYPNDTAGVPWNAYIYDFFKHGDLSALVRDNGIRAGDVWFLLKNFSLILATIVTSLTNFLNLDAPLDDMDAAMIDVQDVGDSTQEYLSQAHETEPPYGLAAMASALPAPTASKERGGKAVADSWDDETDTESSQGEPSPSPGLLSGAAPASVPAWQGEGEQGLARVLASFQKLQLQFDDKFKKVWA